MDTTLLVPLVESLWTGRIRGVGQKNGYDLDRSSLAQITLYRDTEGVVTPDSVPRPLIQSMAHLSSILEIKIGRAGRRKSFGFNKWALDPAIHVRYEAVRRRRIATSFTECGALQRHYRTSPPFSRKYRASSTPDPDLNSRPSIQRWPKSHRPCARRILHAVFAWWITAVCS